jgi:hypothetical protein
MHGTNAMIPGSAPADAVAILLGNGEGRFAGATSFPVGAGPDGVAIADLNGDGWGDLVTANGGPELSVLLGLGDGTFRDETRIPNGGTGASWRWET